MNIRQTIIRSVMRPGGAVERITESRVVSRPDYAPVPVLGGAAVTYSVGLGRYVVNTTTFTKATGIYFTSDPPSGRSNPPS